MSDDQGKTIGDYNFGLSSSELFARFTESLYRELESVGDMGLVDPTLTYSDIAEALVDTFAGYAGMGPIAATDLGGLIKDALEQLAGHADEDEVGVA